MTLSYLSLLKFCPNLHLPEISSGTSLYKATAFMAFLYRYIGIDALSVRSRIKGLPKGELLQKITRKRINKDLPELWDVISASEEAEIYREV